MSSVLSSPPPPVEVACNTPTSPLHKRARAESASEAMRGGVDFSPLERRPVAGVVLTHRGGPDGVTRHVGHVAPTTAEPVERVFVEAEPRSCCGARHPYTLARAQEVAAPGDECVRKQLLKRKRGATRNTLICEVVAAEVGQQPLLASSCIEALANCLAGATLTRGTAGVDATLDALNELLVQCARHNVAVPRVACAALIERRVGALRARAAVLRDTPSFRGARLWGKRQDSKLDSLLRTIDGRDPVRGGRATVEPWIRNPPWLPAGGSSLAAVARLSPPPDDDADDESAAAAATVNAAAASAAAAARAPLLCALVQYSFGPGVLGLTLEVALNSTTLTIVKLNEFATDATRAALRPGDELCGVGDHALTATTPVARALHWIAQEARPVVITFRRKVRAPPLPLPPPPLRVRPIPTGSAADAAVQRARLTIALAQQESADRSFWLSAPHRRGYADVAPPPGCRVTRWEASVLACIQWPICGERRGESESESGSASSAETGEEECG